MIGAGIYVLSGEIVKSVGTLSILSFTLTGLLASFTAYSYIKLSRWYPTSAGESWFVYEAFKSKRLSQLIGWLVVASGVVSASTLTRDIYGYVTTLVDISLPFTILVALLFMTSVCIRGITESMWTMAAMTLIEIVGILWAISAVIPLLDTVSIEEPLWEITPTHWNSLIPAVFLSFYAYIGFEDIVNIAEEVENPGRNISIATITALVVTTILYICVCFSLLIAFTPQNFPDSAPLTHLLLQSYPNAGLAMSLIAILAILNGGMVQLIMASRVLYGMATKGFIPKLFSYIQPQLQTPVLSILFVGIIIGILALLFPVKLLAKFTTFFLLCIFLLINLSLLRISRRTAQPIQQLWPSLGAITCFILLITFFFR